jgi:hypothetical protein
METVSCRSGSHLDQPRIKDPLAAHRPTRLQFRRETRGMSLRSGTPAKQNLHFRQQTCTCPFFSSRPDPPEVPDFSPELLSRHGSVAVHSAVSEVGAHRALAKSVAANYCDGRGKTNEIRDRGRFGSHHIFNGARQGARQAATPKRSSALHFMICWPLAARTRPTRLSISTWRTWQSAGAGPRTA